MTDRSWSTNPIANAAVERGIEFLRRGEPERAVPHFRKAADLGEVDSMYWLGGQGEREEDFEEALHWYMKAAEAGKPAAMFRVAMVYEKSGDISASLPWYRRAAEHGERDAMFNLGNHFNKRGDTAEAIHWLTRAAELGDDDAMRLLGALYFRIETVEVAAPWFQKAAVAGNGDAAATGAVILGALAEDLDSVVLLITLLESSGNAPESQRWIDKARSLGVRDLEHQVAATYEERDDRARAIEWYSKSTLAGNRESLDGIMRLSTTQQFLEWIVSAIERGDEVANDFMTEFREGNEQTVSDQEASSQRAEPQERSRFWKRR